MEIPPMAQPRLRVLFVEDHQALMDNLAEYFSEDRYEADFARDGLTALHLLASHRYDVIVLDVMLPGINGMSICERIRKDLQSSTPVILLTALDSIDDKIKGYGVGADDYLTKPFDMRELELRIRAASKHKNQDSDQLTAGNVRFNPGTLTVTLGSEHSLVLSGLSATLFETLIRAWPRFLSHEDISNSLWGIADVDEHTIRTHVYLLRKQLKQALGKPLIKALYGRGYQLDPEQV